MAAFFGNLRNVVITGFVLAIGVAAIYVGCLHGSIDAVFWGFVTRWLHVIAGVMWIGLLYYFNFVQIPTMPKVPADQKGGITGHIAPAALWWFRYGALATIILGLGLASQSAAYTMGDALTLGLGSSNLTASIIGIGMYLGQITNQTLKQALNIAGKYPSLSPDEKAAAGKTAMIFSRINTMLSIPMLFCMVGAMHI